MRNKGQWKKERASGRKYSGGDSHKAPRAHSRKLVWVAGYSKRDGTKVHGHMRKNS